MVVKQAISRNGTSINAAASEAEFAIILIRFIVIAVEIPKTGITTPSPTQNQPIDRCSRTLCIRTRAD